MGSKITNGPFVGNTFMQANKKNKKINELPAILKICKQSIARKKS